MKARSWKQFTFDHELVLLRSYNHFFVNDPTAIDGDEELPFRLELKIEVDNIKPGFDVWIELSDWHDSFEVFSRSS